MKRLPETFTSCCILICLLTAGTTVRRSDDVHGKNFLFRQAYDTSGLVNLIKVDSFRLEVIPPSSGIQFFKDGIVFLSNTKYEGKMLPKHVSFGSLEAYTGLVKDTSLGFHMLFSPSSSFSFPCEALTFTSDFRTMYFTKIAKKEKKEKIYRAEFKSTDNNNPGWVADENPLNFCNDDYRYTHPALSVDGNMMIFSSDMNGSLGGMDLFMVKKSGALWSKPENLGKSINTAQLECFPFLDRDNNLYYSSDGLAGYGGYDIFTCKFNGDSWDKPRNLSGRINSGNDDIAFTMEKTGEKSAFFTTRHKTGDGVMQLYKVSLKQETIDNNPLSIAYIFNGKPFSKTELVALKSEDQAQPPLKEAEKTVPAEVKTEGKKTASVPATAAPSAKFVIIKPTSMVPDELSNVVVYRIQFLSSTKQRKENAIVMNGITYKTYEYFYLDSYRYTIGEFTSLSPARELQGLCRKSGYPQAFVAAFKGNMRSLDLASFK